jgi:hypothetical protein
VRFGSEIPAAFLARTHSGSHTACEFLCVKLTWNRSPDNVVV